MHTDIVREIHTFDYKGYNTKIVERKMQGKLFLYFYVFDSDGNDAGGMHHVFYDDITQEVLSDIPVAVSKIKSCIDKSIACDLKYEEQIRQKKKQLGWTGRKFNRGDFVHFMGSEKYKPYDTYVWTHFMHEGMDYYLVEHYQGDDRSRWMAKPPFEHNDGFESVHSSQLREGKKYIQIDCHEEFTGETDQLVLIRPEGQK